MLKIDVCVFSGNNVDNWPLCDSVFHYFQCASWACRLQDGGGMVRDRL